MKDGKWETIRREEERKTTGKKETQRKSGEGGERGRK